MRQIKLWAAAAVCGLSLAGNAFGQTKGDEVVVIVKQTDLKSEATVVETISRGNYLTVREVNGNWLWVDCDGTRGWLQRDHVILASRAIEHFTDELRRNPKDDDAFISRAIAWKNKGELTNAIRDCTDAIAINPKWSWAYKIRGNAWMAKQEYDLAISDYEEGLRLNPKDNHFYVGRGRCHHAKKNYDKAIADFTEAIRLNPKRAGNYDGRGDSYRDNEQYDKALADYTMAIELDPQLVGAYLGRAYVFEARKDFARALTELRQTAQFNPESADAHNAAAWLLATCPDASVRDGRLAVEFAQKAVALDVQKGEGPDHHLILDTLAVAYAEAGDFAQALKHQAIAIAKSGSDKNSKLEYESRLKLYQSGQPFRDVPKSEAVSTAAAK